MITFLQLWLKMTMTNIRSISLTRKIWSLSHPRFKHRQSQLEPHLLQFTRLRVHCKKLRTGRWALTTPAKTLTLLKLLLQAWLISTTISTQVVEHSFIQPSLLTRNQQITVYVVTFNIRPHMPVSQLLVPAQGHSAMLLLAVSLWFTLMIVPLLEQKEFGSSLLNSKTGLLLPNLRRTLDSQKQQVQRLFTQAVAQILPHFLHHPTSQTLLMTYLQEMMSK